MIELLIGAICATLLNFIRENKTLRRSAYIEFYTSYVECTNYVLAHNLDDKERTQTLLNRRERFDKALVQLDLYSSNNLQNHLLELRQNLPHKIPEDQSIWSFNLKNNILLTDHQNNDNYNFYFSLYNCQKICKIIKNEINSLEFFFNIG